MAGTENMAGEGQIRKPLSDQINELYLSALESAKSRTYTPRQFRRNPENTPLPSPEKVLSPSKPRKQSKPTPEPCTSLEAPTPIISERSKRGYRVKQTPFSKGPESIPNLHDLPEWTPLRTSETSPVSNTASLGLSGAGLSPALEWTFVTYVAIATAIFASVVVIFLFRLTRKVNKPTKRRILPELPVAEFAPVPSRYPLRSRQRLQSEELLEEQPHQSAQGQTHGKTTQSTRQDPEDELGDLLKEKLRIGDPATGQARNAVHHYFDRPPQRNWRHNLRSTYLWILLGIVLLYALGYELVRRRGVMIAPPLKDAIPHPETHTTWYESRATPTSANGDTEWFRNSPVATSLEKLVKPVLRKSPAVVKLVVHDVLHKKSPGVVKHVVHEVFKKDARGLCFCPKCRQGHVCEYL